MLILVFSFLVPAVGAYDYKKAKGYKKRFNDKVFHKAQFLLKNKEELKLSDKQVKKIKDLKLKAKKDLIAKKADIEILALDIKAKMHEETIDTKAISELIDKKYELKKTKSKSLVEAYAAFKNILTKEQKEKLKGLYRKCKKETGSHK